MSIRNNIYTNTLKEEIFSGNIMIEIADHHLQFISVKPNYFKRDYKMFNEQEFLADIINNDWENDTNVKYNIFIWDLEHYVNKHAPLKKINKREQKIKKPWITDQILKKIKNRNKLFAQRKKPKRFTFKKYLQQI